MHNLSMWILIYSFSDTYYVWAACAPIKIFLIFESIKIGNEIYGKKTVCEHIVIFGWSYFI